MPENPCAGYGEREFILCAEETSQLAGGLHQDFLKNRVQVPQHRLLERFHDLRMHVSRPRAEEQTVG